MDSTVQISVIVCTRNRPDDVKRFLESLDAQTMPPNELVVIDSSDDERTASLLREHVPRARYAVKHVTAPAGLTLQRNIGVAQSGGEYLFFFDDDVVLEERYIDAIMATFDRLRDGNIGGISGRIVNMPPRKKDFEQLFKRVFFLNDQGRGVIKPSGSPSHRHDDQEGFVGVVNGGTTAYRRAVFAKHRFDERLARYAYMEDVDFSCRVSRDFRLYYQPLARLQHLPTTFKKADTRKLRRMMIQNHAYLFRKNLPHDPLHVAAHVISVIGIFLYNFIFLHDLRACRGVLEGIWHGLILNSGPYQDAV